VTKPGLPRSIARDPSLHGVFLTLQKNLKATVDAVAPGVRELGPADRNLVDRSSGTDASLVPTSPTLTVPVARLVAQFLEGRVDGLPASKVAAFVLGWTSALELVRRTDITLPDAPDNVRQGIDLVCAVVEQATRAVLADPDESVSQPSG
jgi:hypothetical protein